MNDQFLVPRLEDLPYVSSPPIQFIYRKTVSLSAGQYIWTSNTPKVLSTLRPLISNSLYYFRSLTIAADVDEGDYLSAITVMPVFQMYLKGSGKQILFREPVAIAKYFQNFDYRLCWFTQRDDDELYATIAGTLTQTAGLIGKSSVTITVIISAQEVVDTAFVNRFKALSYPKTRSES